MNEFQGVWLATDGNSLMTGGSAGATDGRYSVGTIVLPSGGGGKMGGPLLQDTQHEPVDKVELWARRDC